MPNASQNMALRRSEERAAPPVLAVRSGHDQPNPGRFARISGQTAVPGTLPRWESSGTTPDVRPIAITCAVTDVQVVPHGLNNDDRVSWSTAASRRGFQTARPQCQAPRC